MIELVDPRGAPLRLWVAALVDGADGRVLVSPATLAMLERGAGARAEIRVLVP